MGENYLIIVGHFFGDFIKITLFGWDDGYGFFEVAKFESFKIIELGPFVEALGPLLAQNMAQSREQLAIQVRRSHHGVSHLNCSKGWCFLQKFSNCPK